MAAKGSGRVGQKGELFPPKDVREEAGLKSGDQVVYKAEQGQITVVKIPGLKEVSRGEKLRSFEQFEKMTAEVLGESPNILEKAEDKCES